MNVIKRYEQKKLSYMKMIEKCNAVFFGSYVRLFNFLHYGVATVVCQACFH